MESSQQPKELITLLPHFSDKGYNDICDKGIFCDIVKSLIFLLLLLVSNTLRPMFGHIFISQNAGKCGILIHLIFYQSIFVKVLYKNNSFSICFVHMLVKTES